ncbi:monocarboxylate transporter 4-like isoform X3 [Acropora millepora]|uniref:monocarboxylate transporter 4-like isoform X3 n=1 Tax=Acropora millepora TaxID=45264 RepID=UPI0010FC70EB|nr:monocarboxylate transporter 4-like isoform X3 [Acropora millepora]
MPLCGESKCCFSEEKKRKDSPWSWLVLFGASMNLGFTVGLIFSFGILVPVFMEDFKTSTERVAWCGSVSIAMFQGLGPFAGSLINRFGCRVMSIIGCLICAVSLTITSFATHLITLYASYVCLGVGGAFTFLSCLEIVRRSFEKWRSIALGIASAGQGLGTMVLSQVVAALVIVVGWRNSMRILAGALVVNSLFGFLYGSTSATDDSSKKRLITTSVEKQKSKRFSLNLSVFKVPSFLVVAATFFFTMFGRPIIYVLLVKYAKDNDTSDEKASRLFLFMGINIVIGRFVCGFLCAIKSLDNWYIFQGVLFINGVSTMLVNLTTSYFSLAAYALVFGFCDGAMATVRNIQAMTCVDQRQAASSLGFTLMIGSFTTLIGPPISGQTVMEEPLKSQQGRGRCRGSLSGRRTV